MISVFFDSDVVNSSLLSNKGAAYYLTSVIPIQRVVTQYSVEEIERGLRKLNADTSQLHSHITNTFSIIRLSDPLYTLQEHYSPYVLDIFDSHVIAGADVSKARFLVSYNIKHYKTELIKRELGISIVTPAHLIQYLRSLQ